MATDSEPAFHASLRVLYLSWRDQGNPEAGGAEVFAERTAQALTERGHRVTIFSSRFRGAARRTRHRDVDIVRGGGKFSCYLQGMLYALRHQNDFDIVLDVQNGVPFWTPLVTRTPVVNLTHHVHRDLWWAVFPRVVATAGWFAESRVAPWVYRNCRYVTVSRSTRTDLTELGVDAARVDLVYCGNDHPRDLASFDRVPRSADPRIIVLGRLVPHKQVEMAIDVVADLDADLPTLSLDIVGTGYWEPELRQYARDRGVGDRVRFHGFVDDDTKHLLLSQAWVMVVPSHKEGWGLIIVEAGLHGTPSIAFSTAGGPSESILDGLTGRLADDYSQMRELVLELVVDDTQRKTLGEAAREYAFGFSWVSAAERLEMVLLSVLSRPGPRDHADQ